MSNVVVLSNYRAQKAAAKRGAPEQLADEILDKVTEHLQPLERSIRGWPADFREIIWMAVADIATRHANEARQEKAR